MTTLTEIRAIYRGERIRFPNGNDSPTIIGEATLVDSGASAKSVRGGNANSTSGSADAINGIAPGDTIGIKGQPVEESLIPNQTYRLMGRWGTYRNKRTGVNENQFTFSSYIIDQPASREAIISYLVDAGRGRGIGLATATRLWDAWGVEAVATLRESPERITSVLPSFSVHKATQISQWLQERYATEQTSMEIGELLKGRGFPKAVARQAVRMWGNRAAEFIARNPFRLLPFRGCGFKRCDAMYINLGHDPNRRRRQTFALWYAMQASSDGHTWFDASKFGAVALSQSIPKPDLRSAIMLGKLIHKWYPGHDGSIATLRELDGALVGAGGGGQLWIADGGKAEDERKLAEYVVGAMIEGGVCGGGNSSNANSGGGNAGMTVTQWGTVREEVLEIPQYARCARCGRLLTSETIHVLDGKPYGPTCIGYITGEMGGGE